MTTDDQKLEELYQRAEQLAQADSREQLVTVFEKILALDPLEPQAHRFLAQWYTNEKNFEEAVKHYKAFNDLVPNQEDMMLTYAIALEEVRDYQGALKILRRAIRLNENNLFPYLYLGAVYEKMGENEKAGWAYSFAVDLNPSVIAQDKNKVLPRIVVERIVRLSRFLEKIGRDLQKQAVDKAKEKFPKGDFKRIEKALWRKLHGPKVGLVNKLQNPLSFYIPDLAPAPWFERGDFPWVKDLEDHLGLIQKELVQNYHGDKDVKPYLQLGGYDPRSWGDLVGNRSWAAIHFYDGMKKNQETAKKFPHTTKVLDELPLFRVKGTPVEALFSVLKAGTAIPAHFGTSNARLTVHLPLVVPKECYLTAGEEERPVKEGKAMVFDDSFTHKARNESGQVRIVLIFEVWHPDLKEEEQAVVEESYILYEKWMKNRDYDAMIDV